MKKYLLITIVTSIILSACEPTTLLYKTPPTYFGSPHSIPATDSAKQLAVSGSITLPLAAELKSEYRINKNFLITLSYFGNLGAYSHFNNNNIEYRYSTNSFDCQAGYFHRSDKKIGLFLISGYGWGHSISIVPEYDNSVDFIYKADFSRFTITPGIQFTISKQANFSFSWRQSFIQFTKYQLPDTAYNNKKQFLTDMMLNLSVVDKKMGLNIFFGSFLNGLQGGDRQLDQKPEIWRIERFFAGIKLSYRFSLKSGI
jgi:hypothetical protein